MLQKAKTHAIPLGNHVTQQKQTETTENRSAQTKTPNFGIFRFIPVYSALFGCHSASFRCHSGSFRYIPVPFLFIPSHSGVILPNYRPIVKTIAALYMTKYRQSKCQLGYGLLISKEIPKIVRFRFYQ